MPCHRLPAVITAVTLPFSLIASPLKASKVGKALPVIAVTTISIHSAHLRCLHPSRRQSSSRSPVQPYGYQTTSYLSTADVTITFLTLFEFLYCVLLFVFSIICYRPSRLTTVRLSPPYTHATTPYRVLTLGYTTAAGLHAKLADTQTHTLTLSMHSWHLLFRQLHLNMSMTEALTPEQFSFPTVKTPASLTFYFR
jgi:hypothetical protein